MSGAFKNSPKRRKRTPPSKKALAAEQLLHGKTARQVVKIRKKLSKVIPTPKSGAHSKIPPRTLQLVSRKLRTGQITTLREGQQLVQTIDNVKVGVETIRRNLRKERVRVLAQSKNNPPPPSSLSPHHIKARYEFAKKHKTWTVDDWKRVMFSDKSILGFTGSYGRQYFYSDEEHWREALYRISARPDFEVAGGGIVVWGCITYNQRGKIRWLEQGLNSRTYLDLLQSCVSDSFRDDGKDPAQSIFQQNNSPVYTSRVVQKWLAEQEFAVLEWPAHSPDLDVFKHIWDLIKHRFNPDEYKSKDLEDLWVRAQEAWDEIPMDYIHSLYESMPSRIKAILQSKGGPTKYRMTMKRE